MSEPVATQNQVPQESQRRPDKYIWAIFIALVIVSIIELYSASSFEVKAANVFAPLLRHISMLIVGAALALGLSRINYRWFIPLIPIFIIFSVALMIYVLVAGEIVNGARRAITIVGITLQPAEFLKLSAVASIALIMSRAQEKEGVKTGGVILSAVVVIVFGGLLFSQGLTNTLLLMAISLSIMLIAGVQWKKFFVVLLCYGVVAGGALMFKLKDSDDKSPELTTEQLALVGENQSVNRTKTWKARIERYMNNWGEKYNEPIVAENRQEMYAYMAQANGGLIGVMPGNSRETSRLPLAFSDYIFSIVIEDLGFIGGFLLLVIYLSLLARAGNIASRCSRAFPALLVMGMAVMIVFQALFHMAIVTGVFPVSGQPLPLISKGGSSILITSIAFGIMLSVSRFAVQNGKKKEIKAELELLPEEVRADNPAQVQ